MLSVFHLLLVNVHTATEKVKYCQIQIQKVKFLSFLCSFKYTINMTQNMNFNFEIYVLNAVQS